MEVSDVEGLWDKYESLFLQVSGNNKAKIEKLLKDLGDRIIMCPASRQTNEFHAEIGGLVTHSLETAQWVMKLADTYGLEDKKSAVFVALAHDLGKIGDLEHVYFIDQESDWHQRRGIMYDWNPDCPKMAITHRTLFLLQHYGITLDREQWVAIQLSRGMHIEENRFYLGSEPLIATVVQQAKMMAIRD